MFPAGDVLSSNKLLPAALQLHAVVSSQHVRGSTTAMDHIGAWSRALKGNPTLILIKHLQHPTLRINRLLFQRLCERHYYTCTYYMLRWMTKTKSVKLFYASACVTHGSNGWSNTKQRSWMTARNIEFLSVFQHCPKVLDFSAKYKFSLTFKVNGDQSGLSMHYLSISKRLSPSKTHIFFVDYEIKKPVVVVCLSF